MEAGLDWRGPGLGLDVMDVTSHALKKNSL